MKEKGEEKNIPELVRKLNETYAVEFRWEWRRAQKEHVDLFGQTVKPSLYYWRMRMGGPYSDDLKLSATSMERFLFALFAPWPAWEETAERSIQNRMKKTHDIMDQLASDREERKEHDRATMQGYQ